MIAQSLFPGMGRSSPDPNSFDECAGIVTVREYVAPPNFHLQALGLFAVFAIALMMLMLWTKYRREARRY